MDGFRGWFSVLVEMFSRIDDKARLYGRLWLDEFVKNKCSWSLLVNDSI